MILIELQVAQSEAIEILRQIREYIDQNKEDEAKLMIRSQEKVKLKSFGGTSALDLLKKEDKAKRIITFSQKIDEMLEGGVKVGSTTEICGSPGIGKTQLWYVPRPSLAPPPPLIILHTLFQYAVIR